MAPPRVTTPQRQPVSGDGKVTPDNQSDAVARLEAAIRQIQETLDVQFKRMAAMQAEIDLMRMKQKGG